MDSLLAPPTVAVDTTDDRPARPQPPRLVVHAVVGLVASSVIVLGAIAGGRAFVSTVPGSWFFGSPGGPMGSVVARGDHPPALAIVAVYGGLLLLAAAWWRLVRDLDSNRGVAVARVVAVMAVWALPLLLGPPLFSRDVFSYAGQGELVSRHIDPYVYGTGVLGATRFTQLASPLWAHTPSPYGPVFLFLDGVVTTVAGHHVLADLVLLRLVEVIGVALVIAGLPTLARAVGRDPAATVALGAGSPLVLVTLVAGDHNDALMVGLLVAGLAVARRYGPVPGIVLCALAAGVKAPALVGVAFLGWNWAGAAAPTWRRIRRSALAMAIAATTLAVVSAVTGIGWGWVGTVAAEDKVHTGVTPVDAVANAVAGVAHLLGSTVPTGSVRGVFATLGLVAAAAAGAWLLWHSPRLGLVRSLGLSLLLLALLAPVLWDWYLTWGLVVLAPVAVGNLRRALGVLTTVEVLVGAASVFDIFRAVLGEPLGIDLAVVGALGVVALAGGRWACCRDEGRRHPGPALRAVAGGPGVRPSTSGRAEARGGTHGARQDAGAVPRVADSRRR